MTKKPESYDSVAAKHEAQVRIYEAIQDLPHQGQAAYYRAQAASGDLGAWWRRVRAACDETRVLGTSE